MANNSNEPTPMNRTHQEFAQILINLCGGNKELAKIECFNAARQYDRPYPNMRNQYWVDCYQAIIDA